MNIVRSFDINKPGSQFEDLKGGVVGGSILQGTLKVGDVVEIRPGRVLTNHKGNKVCQPIIASVLSLNSDKNALTSAQPGGLIGISLNIDPAVTRANRLAG
jgi:translation initiation factor 2 subunit 3